MELGFPLIGNKTIVSLSPSHHLSHYSFSLLFLSPSSPPPHSTFSPIPHLPRPLSFSVSGNVSSVSQKHRRTQNHPGTNNHGAQTFTLRGRCTLSVLEGSESHPPLGVLHFLRERGNGGNEGKWEWEEGMRRRRGPKRGERSRSVPTQPPGC